MSEICDQILMELGNLANEINFTEIEVPDLGNGFLTPIQKINNELRTYNKLIKISHLNAVSVPKHRDEIFRILVGTDMDIVGVSETNIKKSTPPKLFKMDGYNFFHADRNHTTKGGVGIYVKQDLKAKRIQVKFEKLQPELIFVEVEVLHNKILIGVIYKSPKEYFTAYGDILEILAFMTSKYNNVVLLGDYNIDQLKPETASYKYFKNTILEPLALQQFVKEPTRITKDTSTLIDLVLSNTINNIKHTGVVDIPGISDHCMVYLAFALKRPKFKPKVIRRRDFRNFSEENFNKDMERAPWGNIYSVDDNDLGNQVTILENIYTGIINYHAPFREIKVKKPISSSRLSDEIIRLMDKRDKYKNKYNLCKNTLIYDAYKRLRNQVNHLLRKSKKTEINETVNSKINSSKKFHAALKHHDIVTSKINNEQVCFLDPEVLNTNFTKNNNAAVNEMSLNEEIIKIKNNMLPPTFEFKQVTEKEVIDTVKLIKTNACGIDEISAFFIKMGISYSVHALTEIINTSLRFNVFPDRWKIALIKPIPKCADPKCVTDFRPISLLIAFSKILEKIAAKQMKTYLESNKLLDVFQSAYRENHSTTTALLEIVDSINKALDESEVTLLALLDYSKAFDCANHRLILAKLESLGFKNSALKWVASYLINRSQFVSTDKGVSTKLFLLNGVPQGSILGPLLFTILISDIHKCLKFCKHHVYADDTQIFISDKIQNINNMILRLNEDLNSIACFSKNNCLKLNSTKTNYIIIASEKNISKIKKIELYPVQIDNQIIERKSKVKNLGVIFDECLHFDKQVNYLIGKAFAKLKQAYRSRNFLSTESRIRIVECYILAEFNYCDSLLTNITQELVNKIQKFQNNCVRFIFGLKKYDHINKYFKSLNTLNMENRRILHSLTIMNKIINKRAPLYLSNKIKYNSNIHAYNTRGSDNLVIGRSKNNYGFNSFFNKIAKLYNSVLPKIKINNNTTDVTFKKKCRIYLLNKQFLE